MSALCLVKNYYPEKVKPSLPCAADSTRGGFRVFDVPEKPDKTRFSEENQTYKIKNSDFWIKIGNLNLKI